MAIQSIVYDAVPDEFYDIVILHGGIDDRHKSIYCGAFGNAVNVKIRF